MERAGVVYYTFTCACGTVWTGDCPSLLLDQIISEWHKEHYATDRLDLSHYGRMTLRYLDGSTRVGQLWSTRPMEVKCESGNTRLG